MAAAGPGARRRDAGQVLLGALGLVLALSILGLGVVRLAVATRDRALRDAETAAATAGAQALAACAQAAVAGGRDPDRACAPGRSALPTAFAYPAGQVRLHITATRSGGGGGASKTTKTTKGGKGGKTKTKTGKAWLVTACAAFWPEAGGPAPAAGVEVREALPSKLGGAAAWRTQQAVPRCP